MKPIFHREELELLVKSVDSEKSSRFLKSLILNFTFQSEENELN